MQYIPLHFSVLYLYHISNGCDLKANCVKMFHLYIIFGHYYTVYDYTYTLDLTFSKCN